MNRTRIEPGPGQESVWDYPRPPALEPCQKRVRIVVSGETVADANQSYRVLETSHPPVFYLPRESLRMDLFRPASHGTFCEWKGHAHYFDLVLPDRTIPSAAWTYKSPTARFQPIAGYLAVYPSKMDACYLDDEQVRSQEGDFYGGWITDDIVGPFKGGPGTRGW